ncbi:MAG: protein kinase [Cyanobacteria bacterium SZAS-4]|nr:protein kinase [Cyanobacteria bacterium SZAS-4]
MNNSGDKIRVLIAEDHQITSVGLKLVLEKTERFIVVGIAEDGKAAVESTLQQRPDVVLMDIGLPLVDGLEALYQIKSQLPQVRVIMLTSHTEDEDIFAAQGAGADGYCLKDVSLKHLTDAIDTVHHGGTWLDQRILEKLMQTRQSAGDSMPLISVDDLDLLNYVEQGLSNEEIAVEMGISVKQVRHHMRTAIEALFLSDRQVAPARMRKQFAARFGDIAITSDETNSALEVGDIFAEKYMVKSQVGRGGMGRVYKAVHLHMDRVVAIKILLPQFAKDRRMIRLFQEEAKAAAALIHQNTVQIFDFGISDEGQPFLIMDFIEGRSFETVLRQEGLIDDLTFVSIFSQVCDALQAAHEKDIVHCDLKPSNIVLTEENGTDVVKLIDFGLAKMLPPPNAGVQAQLTESFEVCGSPAYMSPEQCRGGKLDSRSDLYALGCLMYEALTGQQAIQGASAMDCIAKHLQEKPPSFEAVCPDRTIPRALDELIFTLMEKDPRKRCQTVSDVKQVLESVF